MRLDRDTTIFLGLATLAEQVELSIATAPPPSHGVRLALKVLHGFSAGDRDPFDDFWRQMRDGQDRAWSATIASTCRQTMLQTKLRGVMRAVGIEPSVATEQALWRAALRVHPRERRAP